MKMAKLVRSRNPDQCRSHHQKLISYYKDVKTIITHFELEVLTKSKRLKNESVCSKKRRSVVFKKGGKEEL